MKDAMFGKDKFMLLDEDDFHLKEGKKIFRYAEFWKDAPNAVAFEDELGDVYVDERLPLPKELVIGRKTHLHALCGVYTTRSFYNENCVDVGGGFSINDGLWVREALRLKGNCATIDFLYIYGGILNISGGCNIREDVDLTDGEIIVEGGFSCQNMKCQGVEGGIIEFGGDLHVESNFSVGTNFEEVQVGRDAKIGDLRVGGGEGSQKFNVGNSLYVKGNARINGDLTVGRVCRIGGSLDAENVDIGGALVIKGKFVGEEVKVGRDLRVGQNIAVVDIEARGDIVAGGEMESLGVIKAGGNIDAGLSIVAEEIEAELRIFAGMCRDRRLEEGENVIVASRCTGQVAAGVFRRTRSGRNLPGSGRRR